MYSPDRYPPYSRPWENYNRVPMDHHRVPTVMRAYGNARQILARSQGNTRLHQAYFFWGIPLLHPQRTAGGPRIS
eukprot:12026093-Heterocapsa_arctica.AAC.1